MIRDSVARQRLQDVSTAAQRIGVTKQYSASNTLQAQLALKETIVPLKESMGDLGKNIGFILLLAELAVNDNLAVTDFKICQSLKSVYGKTTS